MIENEEQYQITRDWIRKFSESLVQCERQLTASHPKPWILEMLCAAYRGEIETLRLQATAYEAGVRPPPPPPAILLPAAMSPPDATAQSEAGTVAEGSALRAEEPAHTR